MTDKKNTHIEVRNGFIFKFYDEYKLPESSSKKISVDVSVPIDYEPMRRNRFYVIFPEFFNIQPFTIRSISLPAYSNNVWENITMELYDLIGPSTSQSIMNMIRHCSLNQNNILFRFNIQQLDPTGTTVHRWDIDVSELVRVNFGDLNYGEDGLTTCTIELKPQNCILSF